MCRIETISETEILDISPRGLTKSINPFAVQILVKIILNIIYN